MGQRNLLAQKMRQILGAANWQVAMNGRMQTDAGKAHIQLRTCYSFLDQSFSLCFSLVWFSECFFLSVAPVNGFDTGVWRIRILVRLKEYGGLHFALHFACGYSGWPPPLCPYFPLFAVGKLKRTAFLPSSMITRHQVSWFHRWSQKSAAGENQSRFLMASLF